MPRVKRKTTHRQFWEKIEHGSDECWQWSGGKAKNGYGLCHDATRKTQYAHRYAYEELVGPIPHQHDIDHLCHNRLCVNVAHLEPVTRKENLYRGLTSRRVVTCPQGHAYADENLYVNAKGWRFCRTCHRERERIRRKGTL